MALREKGMIKVKSFDLPLSYRINERRERLILGNNCFSNQGRLDTRFGSSRANITAIPDAILSGSFFKNSDGERFRIVKAGTKMYKVAASGSSTVIKTGLTATTKHRGYTFNNRHIILIESDGLFQYDGTTFTQLGQAAPTTPTTALSTWVATLPSARSSATRFLGLPEAGG